MTTRRAGVLGSPIAHSLSPALHRAAYAALGLDWRYDAYDVDEARLPAFIADLDDTWAGLSLTMPLKSAIIPLLASVDDTASALQSVNTVLPVRQGWHGTNTDVFGIVAALRPLLSGGEHRALLLGAGATARSAVAALRDLGITEITVCARRASAVQDIVTLAGGFGIDAAQAPFDASGQLLDHDIIVSTVPGDAGADWAAAARATTSAGVLLDVVYHPWPTVLAASWPNDRIASGRDMLLWQAVEQVRLMTGMPAPVGAMEAALRLEG